MWLLRGALVFVAGLILGCATLVEGTFPRTLMKRQVKPTWLETPSGDSCTGTMIKHARGFRQVFFKAPIVARSSDGSIVPVQTVTVWFREPAWDFIQRLEFSPDGRRICRWDEVYEDPSCSDLEQPEQGPSPVELRLETSSYPQCIDGHVVEAMAVYPHILLVHASGCHDKIVLVHDQSDAERPIELECQEDESHNHGSQLPVGAPSMPASSPVPPLRAAGG